MKEKFRIVLDFMGYLDFLDLFLFKTESFSIIKFLQSMSLDI